MERFRRLGIFLNEEPGDEEAIAFAGQFARLADCESILCVHVRGVEDRSPIPMPDETELRRQVLAKLPETVAARTRVEAHAGTGIREILRSALDESLDLIVVGRRLPHDQRAAGSAFTRLVRKSPCSVLVVPNNSVAHFGRIEVLIDGSEHSRMALETACAVARASNEKNPQVIAHAVYEINYGYRYTGQTFQQAAKQREDVWRQSMTSFLEGIDTAGVAFDVVYSCSHFLSAAAFDLASARNLDMIMMGSRGMSRLTAALVGNTTEIVVHSSPIPLFVVKKKGETAGILDVLLAT